MKSHELQGEKITLQKSNGSDSGKINKILSPNNTTASSFIRKMQKKAIKQVSDAEKAKEQYQRLRNRLPGMLFSLGYNEDRGIYFSHVEGSSETIGIEPIRLEADSTCWSNLLSSDDKIRFDNLLKTAARKQQSWRITLHHDIDGHIRQFEYIVRPLCQRNGDMAWSGIAVEVEDEVTDLKNPDNWDTPFRKIFETINEAILISDAQGCITNVNERFCTMFSVTKQEMQGVRTIDLLKGPQREKWLSQLALRKEGIPDKYQLSFNLPDDRVIVCSMSASPLLDENGSYIGSIVMLNDITNIKASEERAERLQKMLTESQRLAQIGSWELDINSREFILSEEMYRILGLDPHEPVATIDDFIRKMHPENQLKFIAHYKKTKEIQKVEDIEDSLIRPDGSNRYVKVTGTVIKDYQDNPIRVVGCFQDITEQKRYEKELMMYRFCVDQAPDAILWVDQAANFTYANERASQLLGYNQNELLHMSIADLMPGFKKEEWGSRWDQYQKKDMVERNDDARLNRHKDGHLVPVDVSAKHVWIDGNPLHVAFLRDISDRNAMERQLKLTQHTLDRASIGCFWINEKGRFLYGNDKVCQMLGYTRTELLDHYIFDVDPAIKDGWPSMWQRICDMKNLKFVTSHKRKDGSTFPIESTSTLLEYDDQLFTANFVQDITERKRIENKLRLTQFCFDNAQIAIFLIGPDARITMVNDQACKYLGYTQEELCRMKLFDIAPNTDQENWKKHRLQLNKNHSEFVETVHQRKDGTIVPVEVMINQLEWGDGQFATSFVRDITDYKKVEQERIKLQDRIVQIQKLEALGTLAGGIAHDFNNILSAIFGYADLAKLNVAADSTVHRYIEQVCVASNRARKLINQILLFSRQGRSEKVPSDIGIIIKEVLKLIRASIPINIEIQHSVPSNLGAVYADQTQIHQAIMNLCTNAYHSMRHKGGVLTVGLTPVNLKSSEDFPLGEIQPGSYLKLTIADTGCGMNPETLSHIFEPYFTTKDIGEGTGMGLSTILGIVKDHRGTIKVSSTPGEGSKFELFFPLANLKTEQKPTELATLPGGNECILFVDDEFFLIDVATNLLKKLGYRVEARSSGFDALEAFRNTPDKYDLLIADWTMPKMTGDKLVTEIRKIRSHLPVIICTGFSERINEETLEALSIDKLLAKPVTIQELATCIRSVIDK